jgi:hypothetical protein
MNQNVVGFSQLFFFLAMRATSVLEVISGMASGCEATELLHRCKPTTAPGDMAVLH